ncbi:MAG TPA: FAD-dependent monooxygenase, partial [Xanthobacteraceae bacterium]|nr:FAD-dependent monooxygenase [Xanthobacteraceae bacterium]
MSQKNPRKRVAVIGAGLGGLTAAGFLQRAGFEVKVYEQAPAFSRIGAGIILSANVIKVLRRLGLEEPLIAAGIKSQSYVSRAWDTGEIMAEFVFDAASERRYGGPYVHIHRGDLHAVLERGVAPGTIAFDYQLTDLQEINGAMRLTFANRAVSEADIVIGADGIRSKVRDYLLGPEPPQFVGAVAYRAIFPAERLDGFKIPDCTKWWGGDRHCLPYYLTGRRDEVYAIGVVPAAAWEHGDTSIPSSREQYLTSFAGFHADLQRVLEAVETVTLWPIFDRGRNDCWSGGP